MDGVGAANGLRTGFGKAEVGNLGTDGTFPGLFGLGNWGTSRLSPVFPGSLGFVFGFHSPSLLLWFQ